MALAATPRKMTVDEFLDWHEQQDERYELIDGVPVPKYKSLAPDGRMMAGAGRAHNRIFSNVFLMLGNHLRGKPFVPYGSDAAVRTVVDKIRYPDIVIDCSNSSETDRIFSEPVVVVEILSPTTRKTDLTSKLAEYRAIETMRHILIIDPETFEVQRHDCGDLDGFAGFRDLGETVDLPELSAELPLRDIFAGVPAPQDVPPYV